MATNFDGMSDLWAWIRTKRQELATKILRCHYNLLCNRISNIFFLQNWFRSTPNLIYNLLVLISTFSMVRYLASNINLLKSIDLLCLQQVWPSRNRSRQVSRGKSMSSKWNMWIGLFIKLGILCIFSKNWYNIIVGIHTQKS